MAAEGGTATHPLTAALGPRAWAYDFFQAVRRLEASRPDLPRLGTSSRAGDDPVRFGQEPSLAFAPATVASVEDRGPDRAPRLVVRFMGLLGPNGPMPLFFTEYARDRVINAHDRTLVRFLDIFHHRFISLFYRAWAASRQAVWHDRPESDRFAVYVGSLFGLGFESLRDRDALPDVAKLHYAGFLAAQTRPPDALRAMLEDYLRVPVGIDEFVGRWLDLPPGTRCRLGVDPAAATLGRSAIVGARAWDAQQWFRVRLGPLTLAQYERLLPGGATLARVSAMITNFIGYEWAWDVRLILRASEVPSTRLGERGRLGWSTWLRSREMVRDVGDLVLRPRLN